MRNGPDTLLRFLPRGACALLMALALTGCGLFSVSRGDVIGDFQIDYGYAVETLRLSDDGKYSQLIRLKDEFAWTTQSDTWALATEPRAELVLSNPLVIDDGTGHPRANWKTPTKDVRTLPVKKSLGTVSLIVDERRGLAMTKLEPPPASDKKPNIIHLPPTGEVEVQ